MKCFRQGFSLIAISFSLVGCGPSDDDIYAACVEIGNTRKMDDAERIRILSRIGVKPKHLELTKSSIELKYYAAVLLGESASHDDCVLSIKASLRY